MQQASRQQQQTSCLTVKKCFESYWRSFPMRPPQVGHPVCMNHSRPKSVTMTPKISKQRKITTNSRNWGARLTNCTIEYPAASIWKGITFKRAQKVLNRLQMKCGKLGMILGSRMSLGQAKPSTDWFVKLAVHFFSTSMPCSNVVQQAHRKHVRFQTLAEWWIRAVPHSAGSCPWSGA